MGRAGIPLAALLAVLAAAAGCRTPRDTTLKDEPERLLNPFGFQRVAVLPFANQSDESSPESEAQIAKVQGIFSAELQRVEGLRVVPPGEVTTALGAVGVKVNGPADALEVAKALNADAVIVGAVTSFDPYYRPRVGLAVEVYQRTAAPRAAPDILALAERGRPFAIRPGGGAQVPVGVVDRIFDSADRDVDRAARRFAERREAGATPLGAERYLRDVEKYLSFACHRVIVELVLTEERRPRGEYQPVPVGAGARPTTPDR